MPETSENKPRIFISYRREDSRYASGMIADRLGSHFGKEQVIYDVDSLRLGHDFGKQIEREVKSCSYLIAVIGQAWLNARDENGLRRLDDPKDWVRLEIESALSLDIPVIPVLLDDIQLPPRDQLPAGLKELTRRQAHAIHPPPYFSHDLETLVGKIDLIDRDRLEAQVQAEKDRQREEVQREKDRRLKEVAELAEQERQARESLKQIQEERTRLRADLMGEEQQLRETLKRLQEEYQRSEAELAERERQLRETASLTQQERRRLESTLGGRKPDEPAEAALPPREKGQKAREEATTTEAPGTETPGTEIPERKRSKGFWSGHLQAQAEMPGPKEPALPERPPTPVPIPESAAPAQLSAWERGLLVSTAFCGVLAILQRTARLGESDFLINLMNVLGPVIMGLGVAILLTAVWRDRRRFVAAALADLLLAATLSFHVPTGYMIVLLCLVAVATFYAMARLPAGEPGDAAQWFGAEANPHQAELARGPGVTDPLVSPLAAFVVNLVTVYELSPLFSPAPEYDRFYDDIRTSPGLWLRLVALLAFPLAVLAIPPVRRRAGSIANWATIHLALVLAAFGCYSLTTFETSTLCLLILDAVVPPAVATLPLWWRLPFPQTRIVRPLAPGGLVLFEGVAAAVWTYVQLFYLQFGHFDQQSAQAVAEVAWYCRAAAVLAVPALVVACRSRTWLLAAILVFQMAAPFTTPLWRDVPSLGRMTLVLCWLTAIPLALFAVRGTIAAVRKPAAG